MALLHSWRFVNAGVEQNFDLVMNPADWSCFDQQSASNSGTRNSGGTTTAGSTPTRATAPSSLGGVNFARLRTLFGDNHISGSGLGYRCDLLLDRGAADKQAHEGDTTVHRIKILGQKGVDYFPIAGNWNSFGYEIHHSLGGWPGNAGISLNYSGADPSAPFNAANISSGPKVQPGDLMMTCFGGTVPTANFSPTPNTICYETWPFLKAGTWEGKVIDLAVKTVWKSNYAEANGNSYYYKDVHGGTGTPTDFVNSGWIEIQYRLGTISGGSITWTAWTPFDGGTMVFVDSGTQKWVNGSAPYRHYRPTIFRATDTGVDTGAYVKLANYHDFSTDSGYDSSIYVADFDIAQDWADVGLSAPSSGGATNVTPPSVTGTPQVGNTLTGVAGTWTGTPVLTYQWQWDQGSGNWGNVNGATSLSFSCTPTFGGTNVRLAETADGATTVFSSPVAVQNAAGPVYRLVALARQGGSRLINPSGRVSSGGGGL